MQAANADVCRVALATGLRVGDVVALTSDCAKQGVLRCSAAKTGKLVEIPIDSKTALLLKKNAVAGNPYCFPGRKPGKHRTRQSVWADMNKACELLHIPLHISPHSCRKTFAVEVFHKDGLEAVKDKLQHDNVNTTLLYAFSDCNMQGGNDNHIREIAADAAREAFQEFKWEIIDEIRKLFSALS